MKRPKTSMPKRPRMSSNAAAKNPKEAAISLVRLEFDAARLQMGIRQAKDRTATYEEELKRNSAQKKKLLQLFNP